MTEPLRFEVPGIPQPQGSTRSFARNGKVITTSANKQLRPWRDAVCWHARQAMSEPFQGPVSVVLSFKFPRPKGHYGKKGLLLSAPERHTVRPDIDKLVRCVFDALSEAGVWRDDAQACNVYMVKHYDSRPGVFISVEAAE